MFFGKKTVYDKFNFIDVKFMLFDAKFLGRLLNFDSLSESFYILNTSRLFGMGLICLSEVRTSLNLMVLNFLLTVQTGTFPLA